MCLKILLKKKKKIEIKLQNYEHPMMPIASHDYICNMYLKNKICFEKRHVERK